MSDRQPHDGPGARRSRPGPEGVLGRGIVWLAATLLRLLAATWRVEERGWSPLAGGGGALGACWHRDALIAVLHFRSRGFTAPVSRSRDGDWIAGLMDRLGYAPPPRGSSSRGGAAAFRGLARSLRAGTAVAVPVDGPRGPAGVVKAGVVHLARESGVPVTPFWFEVGGAWRFGSWDRMRLPRPFSRVVCVYGDAIPVPGDLLDEQVPSFQARVARALPPDADAGAEAS